MKKPSPKGDERARLYLAGKSLTQIAKLQGVHANTVLASLQALGVPRRPKANELYPTLESVEYKGRRFTWCCKGFWRCTQMSDRANLTRLIWTDTHGCELPKDWVTFFLDGNRNNIAPENVGAMSRADFSRKRLQDAQTKEHLDLCGHYGRLIRAIKADGDPTYWQGLSAKVWATRRARGGVSEQAKQSVATRIERYGAVISQDTRDKMNKSKRAIK